MATTSFGNVELYLNALDKTIQYKNIRKEINDAYWNSDIIPLLYPLWDDPKDKLETFVYREDDSYSVARCKYKKNFKTDSFTWVSYDFDPKAIDDNAATTLKDSLKLKFIEYKDIQENDYQRAVSAEYARTNAITWKRVKIIRQFLLQDSDYTQMPDAPGSDELKELWKQYRQYIRDLPSLQQIDSPYNVVYPITPNEYLERKTLAVDPEVKEKIGDQGTDSTYLTSSYHFWKMQEANLAKYTQRMSFYIASKLATSSSDIDAIAGRIMISPFITKWTAMGHNNAEEEAAAIRLENDKLGVDYLDDLIKKIESGEI
jgi:hypothetical protein